MEKLWKESKYHHNAQTHTQEISLKKIGQKRMISGIRKNI